MPAEAPLEDLQRVHQELQSLQMKHGEAYDEFVEFFKRNRSVGYKNMCKMLMGETTPEELKGVD